MKDITNDTKQQIQLAFDKCFKEGEHNDEQLLRMCRNCESYCGKEHDFSECRNKACFENYLAYVYLEWENAWK